VSDEPEKSLDERLSSLERGLGHRVRPGFAPVSRSKRLSTACHWVILPLQRNHWKIRTGSRNRPAFDVAAARAGINDPGLAVVPLSSGCWRVRITLRCKHTRRVRKV